MMAPNNNTNIDSQGRCRDHPFVQLQRLSPRTGEWKALLDACPLCVMDDNTLASASVSGSCVDVDDLPPHEETNPLVVVRARASQHNEEEVGRGRTSERLPMENGLVTMRGSSRSSSRVRFSSPTQQEGESTAIIPASTSLPAQGTPSSELLSELSCVDGVMSVAGSNGSVGGETPMLTRSALKALPKYKSCEVAMRRSMKESEKVTTMSMDLSIDSDGEEDENGSLYGEQQQQHQQRAMIAHPSGDGDDQSLGDQSVDSVDRTDNSIDLFEAEEKKVELCRQAAPPAPAPQVEQNFPPANPSESIDLRQKNHSYQPPKTMTTTTPTGSSNNNSNSRRHRSVERSNSTSGSSKNKNKRSSSMQIRRPDPEEFPCGASQASGSNNSSSRRSSSSRGRPSNGHGKAASYNNYPPPPPAAQPPRIGHHPPPRDPPPNYANLVVNPEPTYDDEVSTLSFMGNSVHTNPSVTSYSKYADGDDNEAPPPPLYLHEEEPNNNNQAAQRDAAKSEAAEELDDDAPMPPMINTCDYDSKGRCVHHPHIKLRKKKYFGRGWKILMSACPDCCVDELRRIRLVEEHNRKKMRAKLEKSERKQQQQQQQQQRRTMLDRSDRSTSSGMSGGRGGRRASSSNNGGGGGGNLRSSFQSAASTGSSAVTPRRGTAAATSSSSSGTMMMMNPPPPPPPRTTQPPKRSPSEDSHRSYQSRIKRSPSQESFRSAPPQQQQPPPRRSPSQDSFRRRSPSQDSFRDASVSLVVANNINNNKNKTRRSPSQDSHRSGGGKILTPTLTNANKIRRPSDDTASLTGSSSDEYHLDSSNRSATAGSNNLLQIRHASSQGSAGILPLSRNPSVEQINMTLQRNSLTLSSLANDGSNANPANDAGSNTTKKKRRSKSNNSQRNTNTMEKQDSFSSSTKPPPQQQQQQQPQAERGTIHVRQMQWTDAKGNAGIYTGQVNERFVPHGNGAMVYDHAGGKTREGEWKNGRYRRGNGSGVGGAGGRRGSSRSRSKSRDVSEHQQQHQQQRQQRPPRSSRSRSRSTSGRQRSLSRQPIQPVPAAA